MTQPQMESGGLCEVAGGAFVTGALATSYKPAFAGWPVNSRAAGRDSAITISMLLWIE